VCLLNSLTPVYMMSKVYLTVLGISNPEYPEGMKEYQGIAGEPQAKTIIVAEFPSQEAIDKIFDGE
jgi:hypothetical protein